VKSNNKETTEATAINSNKLTTEINRNTTETGNEGIKNQNTTSKENETITTKPIEPNNHEKKSKNPKGYDSDQNDNRERSRAKDTKAQILTIFFKIK